MSIKNILKSSPAGLLIDLLLVYVCYEVCRIAFLLENLDQFPSLTWSEMARMSGGGWLFDSSAIFYTNALFILLYIFPLHIKEKRWYRSMTKWIFVAVNSLAVIINLADSVFFSFRMQRSTMAIFSEFRNEDNLASLLWPEIVSHWYFVLLAAALVYFLIKCYRRPAPVTRPLRRYYITNTVTFIVVGFAAFCGMRGNIFFLSATRPISVGYAHRFVKDPVETGIVLNTPFSLIRTVGQVMPETPVFFENREELDAIYSPLHMPADSLTQRRKNIVILIVESFAQEFVGALNRDLDNGTYKGYTPFTDSLLEHCMYFDRMFDNTGFSIDAPPAILASIPRMNRPFVVSPHSLNNINSLASELKHMGYYSEFFHGADNESLGFHAFTKSAGFDAYSGMTEFYADGRFGGKEQFDGHWGIWDEPFLQFFCSKIGRMPQPFLATVFTLSSHHPFKVPEKYKDVFTDEGIHKLHKCIKYTDYSLKRFFETASKQPWYNNTIFVITADHGSSKRTHDEYLSDFGSSRIPILFFDPSGELPRGRQPGIAQQIDIMPTLLGYVGYDRPYIAFGKDLLKCPPPDTWAISWINIPRFVSGDYVMEMIDNRPSSLYDYRADPLLKQNLLGTGLPVEAEMERKFKAVIQSYIQRMNTNDVSIKDYKQ